MSDLKNNSPPRHRLSVTPASYVLLRRDNKVLMTRRFNTGYMDGCWSLPAGHFDGGEPANLVAIREAGEEVGVTIAEKDLKLVHVLHRVAQEGGYERIDFFFETTKWVGQATVLEPGKCDGAEWFSVDALPKLMTPEVSQALKVIAEGLSFSSLSF